MQESAIPAVALCSSHFAPHGTFRLLLLCLKAADRGGKGKKGRQRCCLSALACIPFLAASSGCLCRPDRLGECRWPEWKEEAADGFLPALWEAAGQTQHLEQAIFLCCSAALLHVWQCFGTVLLQYNMIIFFLTEIKLIAKAGEINSSSFSYISCSEILLPWSQKLDFFFF